MATFSAVGSLVSLSVELPAARRSNRGSCIFLPDRCIWHSSIAVLSFFVRALRLRRTQCRRIRWTAQLQRQPPIQSCVPTYYVPAFRSPVFQEAEPVMSAETIVDPIRISATSTPPKQNIEIKTFLCSMCSPNHMLPSVWFASKVQDSEMLMGNLSCACRVLCKQRTRTMCVQSARGGDHRKNIAPPMQPSIPFHAVSLMLQLHGRPKKITLQQPNQQHIASAQLRVSFPA